jgi:hypothetical protein
MAENNAGREEWPETGSEEETSSREYTTDSEGTVGEVQGTKEERIAQAIEGKGEFLSEELKKLLREIEVVQGLRAGALGEEIEALLRGVTEPSVERLKEALREEMDKLEGGFLTRKSRDDAGGRLGGCTAAEPGEDPGGTQRPTEAPDGGGPQGRGGIYVPEVDNTLRVVPAPESKGLRSQESEAAQQFKYVEDFCAELELAVIGGNTREVKCQRRALTSGLRQAEEAIVRTAEAHRWTKAALDRALDDVRGRALPQREEADHFLWAEEQEQRSKWMSVCKRMAQNAINLASQATRALTISDWSHQDCEEFLDDLEREFKKVNKALDTYSPLDCEPGVKRRMADCRLRLEAARFEAEKVVTRLIRDHEALGQVSREGRPKGKAPDVRMEPRDQGEAEPPTPGTQLVRFGSLRSERNEAGTGEPEEDRPRSSRSTREGKHTTSTPTGSDREQRLKEGLEEVSGIRGARLPTPAPRREVSPGRSSSRKMYPSPTDSSDDEYDSYTKAGRGRRAEGRSSSPKPRKSDEWRGWNKWDRPERRREDSPEEGEPPGSRRTAPRRPGRPRSSSREKGYVDSQRDVNEGTINVLRSMHAKLMTMQGQTGKNSGYPYFEGKLKENPKFRRRWHTFQDLYHKATPQRELVNLFRENCLEKKVADRLRCEETMAGCWRVLDPFYSRPTQFAQDLMSEITATKRIQYS